MCNIIKPRSLYTINKPTQNYYLCLVERCRNEIDQCLHMVWCQLSAAVFVPCYIYAAHRTETRAFEFIL